MDLFVVNHYAVADLHDPGYFTNRSESSSNEHVTEDGVPESKSFVVNFRKETSVSTLDHEEDQEVSSTFNIVLFPQTFHRPF